MSMDLKKRRKNAYVTPISTGECTKAVLAKVLNRHQKDVKTSTTVQIAKAKNGHRVPNKIQGISNPHQ